MIKGIGTDLIEIGRIEKACAAEAFLVRYFTDKERELIGGHPQKAAGNFAVKEAVSKVFGTGVRGFGLKDIEVLRDQRGKPYVNLYGEALKLSAALGIDRIHVSISNTGTLAIAYAVGEGEE